MKEIDVTRVHFLRIDENDAGQRVDNFIRKRYPGLPKSRIYQMLRKGEVRCNKKRVKPTTKLNVGDALRMPPVIDATRDAVGVPIFWCERIVQSVLYEDDDFLVLNKSAGISVHGGSQQSYGLIDVVREVWGDGYAELAHRLDRDTSGVLVLGKHRRALSRFQDLMRSGEVEKRYCALVNGCWDASVTEVSLFLQKGEKLGGERMVVTDNEEGQIARTFFYILREFSRATLLEAVLDTGRTHQIRVSAQTQGHGIAGDSKYGDERFNRYVRDLGFRGMFLHAKEICFRFNDQLISVQAPLPEAHENLLLQGDLL